MESFGDGMPPVTSDTMRLVTINVDGMFNADGTRNFKGRSSKDRIQGILEEVLGVSPDIISMQEVVPEMYGVLHHQLTHLHWKVYRRRIHENQKHFVVTAVREQAEESTDHTTTHAWLNSKDGRHTLTVRRRGWAVTNVNCESG